MAQIIKHRRGTLESLSNVTASLSKGEIVIASGSSNISPTNGSSIVFAAVENGQVQAINRVMRGSTIPNTFANSTYNGLVNGVPYYVSASNLIPTLYLLGTDSNEAIDLIGNIQPFSASIVSRVVTIENAGVQSVVNLNQYTASANARFAALEVSTGSVNTFTASTAASLTNLNLSSASQQASIAAINVSTGSLNTFTASAESKFSAIQASTASLNSKTGSYATTGSNIFIGDQTITGSLAINDSATNFLIEGNPFGQTYLTAGGAIVLNPGFGGVEMVGSYRTFKATDITADGFVSGEIRANNGVVSGSSQIIGILDGLNVSSASQQVSINALSVSTGSLNTFTASASSRLINLESKSASVDASLVNINSYTASVSTSVFNINNYTASVSTSVFNLNVLTASAAGRLSNLESKSASVDVHIAAINASSASLNSFTASTAASLINLNLSSASQQASVNALSTYTGSNDTTNTIQNTRLDLLSNKTGSYATTGSNTFNGTQVISGSLYITQDLIVIGSSSISNVSASSLDIGANQITLNTFTPAIRFGGISVVDSGSTGGTGSLWWDSVNNHWIYEHPADSEDTYNSAMLISGPKNTGTLGNETGLISGAFAIAVGDDHISSSMMTQATDNSKIVIGGGLNVNGEISASTINGIGNVTTFSQSVDTRLDAVELSIGGGSVTSAINALNASTASLNVSSASQQVSLNALNVSSASVNTFTASASSRLSNLEIKSGSVDASLTNLNTYTASVSTSVYNLNIYTASVSTSVFNLNASTASSTIKFTNLEAKSASVDASIVALNVSSASLNVSSASQQSSIVALNVSTSSLNTFTASATSRFTNLEIKSGSVDASVSALNTYTTSVSAALWNLNTYTNSVSTSVSTLNTFTASTTSRLSNLETKSGSVDASLTNLNTYTASVSTSVYNLNIYTASVSTSVLNLNISSASQQVSIVAINVSTSSLNTFTASAASRLVNLETKSASVDISITNLNLSSGSQQTSINGLNVSTSSINAFTASAASRLSNLELDSASADVSIIALNVATSSINSYTASLKSAISVNGANLTVLGDLTVQGSTVTLNTTELIVEDKLIVLASGSTTSLQSDGSGIYISGSAATFTYSNTADAWTANKPFSGSAFTGSFNLPTGGSSKRIAFRETNGNLDLVIAPTVDGDFLQWNGSAFTMSNVIDGGSF